MAVRYFAEFDQENNRPEIMSVDVIRIEIADNSYVGDAEELLCAGSPLRIDYTNTGDNKLSPVRGSQATMNFVATENFALEDLYTDDYFKWIVTIYRSSQVIWRGFVRPDGCSERFVDPPYVVTVRAVDGLVLLDSIDYLEVPYLPYTGFSSFLQIISRCLNKTRLGMNINTYANISYNGMIAGTDVFVESHIRNERFGVDYKSIMTCGDVLRSIFQEFICFITQYNGEWVIIRIPDLTAGSGNIPFYKYDKDGTFLTRNNVTPLKAIGNNSGDVIHCNNDQLKAVDFPYKQISVRYEYGLFPSLISQDASVFNWPLVVLEPIGWNIVGGLDVDSLMREGEQVGIYISGEKDDAKYLELENPITVTGGDVINIEFSFNAYLNAGIRFVAKVGTQYMYLDYQDDKQPKWSTDSSRGLILFDNRGQFAKNQTISITTEIPVSGDLEIRFYGAYTPFAGTSPFTAYYEYVKITPSPASGDRILSETVTAINDADFTKIGDTVNVFNGDSISKVYLGTIFKSDNDTPAEEWHRRGAGAYKKFIQLAAEDIIYQYGRPMYKYEGSLYGYFDYFSIFTIDGLGGVFLPVSVSYDIRKNQTSVTLIEIDHTEISAEYRTDFELYE